MPRSPLAGRTLTRSLVTNGKEPRRRTVRRRSRWKFAIRLPIALMLVSTVLCASSAAAASNPFTSAHAVALKIADYAVATATHDHPAHAADAADVTNAVETDTLNTLHLELVINLGADLGFGRLIDLVDTKSFANTCIVFPASVGTAPHITPCPDQAVGEWEVLVTVLNLARDAVAIGASHDRAVSGADVVKENARWHMTLGATPTFKAGQGGVVKFAEKLEMTNTNFVVSICVRFPKTAYGLPEQVAC